MPAHIKEHNKEMFDGKVSISLPDFSKTEQLHDIEGHWSSYLNLSDLSLDDSQGFVSSVSGSLNSLV